MFYLNLRPISLFLSLLKSPSHPIELLGVIISSNLKCHIHVKNILHKANTSISMNLVSPFYSSKINTSFVHPNLEYACQVWNPGISRKKSIKKIKHSKKELLQMIFTEDIKSPYSLLLKKCYVKNA